MMIPYICMVSARQRLPSASSDGPTARQLEIAAYVERALASGRAPSRKDIAEHFGFNRATAQEHVVALERHGVLRRLPGARGIVMAHRSENSSSIRSVPIIGRVAAGQPLLAVEDHEDTLQVPDDLFRAPTDVLLRVQGDSMIDAGILDRDLIAVALRSVAENGDIIVARLDDEITVKRFKHTRRRIELVAENQAYSPIVITSGREFSIEGVVLGVMRRF